jgi:hypothetical protein
MHPPVDLAEDLERFNARLATYLKPEDITRVGAAYVFANAAHRGQMRLTGAPYISHPLAVAETLAGWHLDPHALTAALAARRDGGHGDHQGPDRRALRQGRRRTRRWRLQARPHRAPELRGSPGRELRQDAAGHGARRARDPDQAGRPPAQHADPRRHAPRKAAPHRARNPGNLRADRQPARPQRALPRIAGAGLPPRPPAALPGTVESRQGRARQSARSGHPHPRRHPQGACPPPASMPK